MNDYPLEGEKFEWKVRLAVSNIVITKNAVVQRLGKKVFIIIKQDTEQEAENLVTSLGADPAP